MTHWFSRDPKTGQEIQPDFAAFRTPFLKEAVGLPSLEFEEKTFKKIFDLECKRSEKSKRPFIFILVSFEGGLDTANEKDLSKKVFSCLATCKRDIDVLGWYRSGSVIGMIFTEISYPDNAISERIIERIRLKLSSDFRSDQISKVNISLNVLPEKHWSEVLPIHRTFNLDNRQNGHLQKSPFLNRVSNFARSASSLFNMGTRVLNHAAFKIGRA